ncbi:MAG: hypothetical protein LBG94_00715 [Treponema sp.]|nr:hypothetical protein [Treponema sp.]
MKNNFKFLGLITFITVMGFLTMSCAGLFGINDGSSGTSSASSSSRTSLNGVWRNNYLGITITINGETGVFTVIDSDVAWNRVMQNGLIKIGDPKVRDITRTGDNEWIAQELFYTDGFNDTIWRSIGIMMHDEGQTMHLGAAGKTIDEARFTRVR